MIVERASFRPQLSWRRVLIDGGAMSGGLSLLIGASMMVNPEIWVQDYPPDIREAYGPKSRKAQIQGVLLSLPFFGILLGGAVWSNRRLRQEKGGPLRFTAAFWHTYALFALFWLFDLVVLDWLVFVTLTPAAAVLPGTEGMEGYNDYAFHLKVSLPALPLMAFPALVIAFLVRSRPPG